VSVPSEGAAIVSQGQIGNLRELQGLLGELGIESQLVAPPKERQSS
jgi:hypothetical protein